MKVRILLERCLSLRVPMNLIERIPKAFLKHCSNHHQVSLFGEKFDWTEEQIGHSTSDQDSNRSATLRYDPRSKYRDEEMSDPWSQINKSDKGLRLGLLFGQFFPQTRHPEILLDCVPEDEKEMSSQFVVSNQELETHYLLNSKGVISIRRRERSI